MIVDSDSEVQRFAAFARLLTLAMRRDIEPETHVLSLGMIADGKKADAIRGEIIEIVKAWQRGRLAPRSVAPLLLGLYELLGAYDELGFPRPEPPEGPAT
jgi:hypothetical protein